MNIESSPVRRRKSKAIRPRSSPGTALSLRPRQRWYHSRWFPAPRVSSIPASPGPSILYSSPVAPSTPTPNLIHSGLETTLKRA